MNKFKVGDRVRVVANPCLRHSVGDEGIITRDYRFSKYRYTVDVVGRATGGYETNELELINERAEESTHPFKVGVKYYTMDTNQIILKTEKEK